MNSLDELLAPYGELLDVTQLASALGWTPDEAADLLRSGELPHIGDATGVFVPKDALRAFLLERRHFRPEPPFIPHRRTGLPPLGVAMSAFAGVE